MGAVDFTPDFTLLCVVGAAMATSDTARTSRPLDESPWWVRLHWLYSSNFCSSRKFSSKGFFFLRQVIALATFLFLYVFFYFGTVVAPYHFFPIFLYQISFSDVEIPLLMIVWVLICLLYTLFGLSWSKFQCCSLHLSLAHFPLVDHWQNTCKASMQTVTTSTQFNIHLSEWSP